MEKKLLDTVLRKKGLYYYLTKYTVLTSLVICILTVIIDGIYYSWRRIPIGRYLLVLGVTSAIFLFCQMVFARFFPHRVTVLNDGLTFIGPWKMGEQTIKYKDIKIIYRSEDVLRIQPKWPGISAVYITKSLDPNKKIRETLLSVAKGHSNIELREMKRIINV